jgi:hypothetical protein
MDLIYKLIYLMLTILKKNILRSLKTSSHWKSIFSNIYFFFTLFSSHIDIIRIFVADMVWSHGLWSSMLDHCRWGLACWWNYASVPIRWDSKYQTLEELSKKLHSSSSRNLQNKVFALCPQLQYEVVKHKVLVLEQQNKINKTNAVK